MEYTIVYYIVGHEYESVKYETEQTPIIPRKGEEVAFCGMGDGNVSGIVEKIEHHIDSGYTGVYHEIKIGLVDKNELFSQMMVLGSEALAEIDHE